MPGSKPNPGVPKPPSPVNRRFGLGIPDPAALSTALRTMGREMRQAAMNALQRGPAPVRPLGNPQAGVGGFQAPTAMDSYRIPDDTTLEHACDLVAVAGMSLLRDIPLAQLATHPIAQQLATTLEAMGAVGTPGVLVAPGPDGLFRLSASQVGADRVGRLVLAPIPLGGSEASFNARRRYGDYVGTEAAWQALQAGRPPGSAPELPRQYPHHAQPTPMSTGRDIASLVHQDWPIQIPELVACQLLWAGAARSRRFPALPNEAGFIDYGGAFDVICAVNSCRAAARLAWFVKIAQERARPHELWRDAIAGRLHPAIQQHAGWLLELVPYLTSAYAEMSPVHSDNPSGHAFFAGWGFTILKAYFADVPVPSLGITSLHAELDLFAWHMAAGRSWAGIHTIASLRAGLAWGEHAAVSHLATLATESTQKLGPTTFTGFFGNVVTVPGN